MSQQRKVSGRATSIVSRNGEILVTYHNTVVVAFGNGRVTLDSGGWRTSTTKTRMNQASAQFALGFHVTQEKGEWYVDTKDGRIPFTDGMTFPY